MFKIIKINLSLTVIVLLALFAFSCKKEIQEFDLSPEIKALWDFKPGTYWIYQDSISGETDSVYVFNYTQRYDYARGSKNFTGKDAEFQEVTYQYNLFSKKILNRISKDPTDLSEVLLQHESNSNNVEPWLFYEKKQNEVIPNIKYCKDMTIIIEAPLFYNSSSYDNSPIKKYCAMPNIGIVRYEFKDGRVYKLIRQHIVQ